MSGERVTIRDCWITAERLRAHFPKADGDDVEAANEALARAWSTNFGIDSVLKDEAQTLVGEVIAGLLGREADHSDWVRVAAVRRARAKSFAEGREASRVYRARHGTEAWAEYRRGWDAVDQ